MVALLCYQGTPQNASSAQHTTLAPAVRLRDTPARLMSPILYSTGMSDGVESERGCEAACRDRAGLVRMIGTGYSKLIYTLTLYLERLVLYKKTRKSIFTVRVLSL